MRVAAAAVGVAWIATLAAYVVNVSTSQATPGGVISALSLLAIAGIGILYAWRPGAGTLD